MSKAINILAVVGAHPNFMKIAPLIRSIKENSEQFAVKLLHTGQHYDYEMSRIFFEELGIKDPDIYLGIGGGSHAEQTGKVMMAFEKVLDDESPDLVVVVGDVNATLACSLTAVKKHIPVAHVEAGLRSYDRSMPEEINRIITDSISDLLFTPSIDGNMNLVKEGIDQNKVHFVGNIMIDTLYQMLPASENSEVLSDLDISGNYYGVITLHRPSNVDNEETFKSLIDVFNKISTELPLVWPVHPRSQNRAEEFAIWEDLQKVDNLKLLEPVGYLDMIHLLNNASIVLTDSGGIQEETTALGVPCVTIRENTERPITITDGTNHLAGTDPDTILNISEMIFNGERNTLKQKKKPLYWDGKTSERILEVLIDYFQLD